MTQTMHRLAAAALFLLAVTGCGEKARPPAVDELRGTYRGVGIGDTTAKVERVFGHESLSDYEEPLAPRKEDFVDIGGPTVIAGGCGTKLRYGHVTFFVCDGRVDGFIVAQSGAHTTRGIAIGDDAKKARARYPQLTCGESPFEGGSYHTAADGSQHTAGCGSAATRSAASRSPPSLSAPRLPTGACYLVQVRISANTA
jgi:hypothetical protein